MNGLVVVTCLASARFGAAREVIRRIVEVLHEVNESFGALRLCQHDRPSCRETPAVYRWGAWRGTDPRVTGPLGAHAELRHRSIGCARSIHSASGSRRTYTMPDLTRCAARQPRRAGAIGLHFPDVEFVVEQNALIVCGPARDAERRFVRACIVRFPVGEGCGDGRQ